MKRREILKYTALMTGAALSAPLLLSLEGCKTDASIQDKKYTLQFFSDQQMNLVKSIVDTILPKTDSPSATEVGVHHIIDQMVSEVYKEEDQKSYLSNFEKLSNYINKKSKGIDFDALSNQEKMVILNDLNKEENAENNEAKKSFVDLKQQTIAYYLSTEEIATNYLNYLPTPGPYEGCISLASVDGKAWAI